MLIWCCCWEGRAKRQKGRKDKKEGRFVSAPRKRRWHPARVQIFDHQGNFQRKFDSRGKEDGQFANVDSLASDAHGNMLVADCDSTRLQVFNSEGEHLCTRNDLGLKVSSNKGLAWGVHG